MMNSAAIAFCMVLFAAATDGATVEVSTEGWTDSGVINGWSFANLGEPFADGAAKMGDGTWIASPTWPRASVLSATVTVECSTNAPDRFPQITFLYDDGQPAKPIRFSTVSRADTAEVQTYDANPSRSARGIKISSGTGTCGDWGIFKMALHAKGELAVDSPKSPGLILIIR